LNFSYDPVLALKNKCYCFKGEISNFLGHPVMTVDRESAVKEYGGE